MAKWWRGRRIDGPKYERAMYPRSTRPGLGPAKLLVTVTVGAALAVLIVYPLLPEDAQAEILQVQQNVAELAPWLQGR